MGPGLSKWVSDWLFVDLIDVSLVDEDANPILADHTNRAIPGNFEMQVAQPGDQIWIRSKFRHLEATFCV